MDERKKLPGIDRPSLGFEFGLKRIGKRQIHIVAAQENVFADADAFELQRATAVGNGDQAEIGGAAADITDQDDVTRTDQGTPLPTCLRDPGVERCLRFFKQGDFAKTRGLRRFGGQILRNCIE